MPRRSFVTNLSLAQAEKTDLDYLGWLWKTLRWFPLVPRWNDADALASYGQETPGYKSVGIDSNFTNLSGGATHYTTMQVPIFP